MPLCTLQFAGPVAMLALNRPEARNALSVDLLADLHARLDELAALCAKDPSGATGPRVCVVEGEGKAFCAGMDLKAVLDQPGAPAKLLASLAEATLKLRAIPIPTIARVQGAAIGGGCGVACVCDFAITHDDAKWGYPEVDLGVCPAVVAPWLIRRIGAGAARRVLLEGGTMPGSRAAALGLASRSVPRAEDLDAAVTELAKRLVDAGPRALRATKAWLNTLDGSDDVGAQVRRGAAISAEVVSSPEARQALRKKFGGV